MTANIRSEVEVGVRLEVSEGCPFGARDGDAVLGGFMANIRSEVEVGVRLEVFEHDPVTRPPVLRGRASRLALGLGLG